MSWDGSAHFDGARVISAEAINFFNRDKTLEVTGNATLTWKSVTTGNQAGFIAALDDGNTGNLRLQTPLIEATVPLAEIGYDDTVLDASGILPRRVRMFRLPEPNPHLDVRIQRRLKPVAGRDNPFYVRITLEDGTQAWSSPVYILRALG